MKVDMLVILLILLGSNGPALCGILYPKASETRELISLDGLWNFVPSPSNNKLIGYNQQWYKSNLDKLELVEPILMPVPSSYNDITQEAALRDHVGLVWYDRNFFVPKSWKSNRVWLRFSSVSYAAQVWVNGELVMSHEVGHLPFEKEVTSLLNFGQENTVTVACDNTLLSDTVPQGTVQEITGDFGKRYQQSYTFDFFNYAGIHRPVTLYTTPLDYIDDITVHTSIDDDGETGQVKYSIDYVAIETPFLNVSLLDKEGNVVALGYGSKEGTLQVNNAKFWWPYLMHPEPGYLYTLQIELLSSKKELIDIYRLPVGIRTLAWSANTFTINDKPIYFQGFGRHEDADIRGKGLDLPTIIKDHNLLRWIGANAYRTSHYPYAEEIMDLADQLGIMIIDECPSVNTEKFSKSLLKKHVQSLKELTNRDKNRPSVVAWSIANEPTTQTTEAEQYFGYVVDSVRVMDPSRPITIAIARGVYEDKVCKLLDIVSFNRYNAWYSNAGQLDTIINNVVKEAQEWHDKCNKPVLMSEYGGDTMIGLHFDPAFIWSEEFQTILLSRHFMAFDQLRDNSWWLGEFVWNFADFKTGQSYTRVGGNRKGVFTRERQPKQAAFLLRKRYHTLSKQLYNASIPQDLNIYVAHGYHDEL